MERLRGVVRDYEWGTSDVLADLVGLPADGRPLAEWWLGGHPQGAATLTEGGRLDDAVAAAPDSVLGPRVSALFGARLPFLLKVLSAAKPLSLQVHPDAEQAIGGFATEEQGLVSREAPERRYRDSHHKPEMVVALGPFEALCGLRDGAAVAAELSTVPLDDDRWRWLLGVLGSGPEGPGRVLSWLLGGDPDVRSLVDAVTRCTTHRSPPSVQLAARLAEHHPGDPGVLVSLLMHHVTLQDGEALHLPTCNLHAYLSGTAVEVMACSDNVLRAGLTSKFVDTEELLRVLDTRPRPLPRVTPSTEGVLRWYRPDVEEFWLLRADLGASEGRWVSVPPTGPRIAVVLDGQVELLAGGGEVDATRGQAVLVPHDDGPVRMRGDGVVFMAGVP